MTHYPTRRARRFAPIAMDQHWHSVGYHHLDLDRRFDSSVRYLDRRRHHYRFRQRDTFGCVFEHFRFYRHRDSVALDRQQSDAPHDPSPLRQ